MFLTWSSWLRATTLNTMRRNCSSTASAAARAGGSPARPARRRRRPAWLKSKWASAPSDCMCSLSPSARRSKRRVMKWRRPFSSSRRHSVIAMPAALAIASSRRTRWRRSPAGLRAPCPCCRARRRTSAASTRSPAPASTWPERTSLVAGFQAMIAFARAPPADVPTLRMSSQRLLLAAGSASEAPSVVAMGSTSEASSTSASISIFVARRRRRPQGRLELQRPHAARADVAQALDRVEARGRAALRREPGIDQRVAESVRQRIREQAGQAVEGSARSGREAVAATPAAS